MRMRRHMKRACDIAFGASVRVTRRRARIAQRSVTMTRRRRRCAGARVRATEQYACCKLACVPHALSHLRTLMHPSSSSRPSPRADATPSSPLTHSRRRTLCNTPLFTRAHSLHLIPCDSFQHIHVYIDVCLRVHSGVPLVYVRVYMRE